jgi:hypothetical protein
MGLSPGVFFRVDEGTVPYPTDQGMALRRQVQSVGHRRRVGVHFEFNADFGERAGLVRMAKVNHFAERVVFETGRA